MSQLLDFPAEYRATAQQAVVRRPPRAQRDRVGPEVTNRVERCLWEGKDDVRVRLQGFDKAAYVDRPMPSGDPFEQRDLRHGGDRLSPMSRSDCG